MALLDPRPGFVFPLVLLVFDSTRIVFFLLVEVVSGLCPSQVSVLSLDVGLFLHLPGTVFFDFFT